MSYSVADFEKFIAARSLVSLPGGFGTTLQLEGYELKPESWSGEANLSAPHLIGKTHRSFHKAGADIHTTNTFRTHRAFMERVHAKFADYAEALLRRCRSDSPLVRDFRNTGEELAYWASKRAVDAALEVQSQSDRQVLVGGSYGPLNDTHSHDPNNTIPLNQLRIGHTEHATLLKDLGVDVLFPETIPTLPEAIAMTEAAEATGLPYITSFVLDPATGHLFDGTSIETAVKETSSPNRAAVLFNCTPAWVIGPALDKLLNCYDGPVGAYPNGGGNPAADGAGWIHDEMAGAINPFVDLILNWASKSDRVKILGGCCGASPAYIHALNGALREENYIAPKNPRHRFFATATDDHTGCACHNPRFAGLPSMNGAGG